ncbi:hypothetical protein [Lichenihabitans psoromatis]|uniref:hypothetical protein n=1 Tax=Lichenihabitans psoromatis TaxID=2528642 RepID=UPI001038430F|nr:hypothetical protein [Lichenihabitans psoromatis]
MFDLILIVVTALLVAGPPVPPPLPSAWSRPVAFNPKEREVTNWRSEALLHLTLPPTADVRLATGRDAPQVTRCVRLNNYWCIKRAGWAGEIAADRDGHVAFSSAREGADVAALLLRRYYLDYGRHSAMAIISHWAPAECGVDMRGGTNRADGLSTRGLGRTLRGRFLASRGRHRIAGRAGRLHRSVVPDRQIVLARAPSIAVGLGERAVNLPTLPLSSLSLQAFGAGPSGGLPTCGGDQARIKAYASKTAEGVASGIDADLNLFLSDGTPTASLARVMHNMSAVEIGPLGANDALVRAAVDRAIAVQTEQARAVKTAP